MGPLSGKAYGDSFDKQPAPERMFPKWTANEQDFWMDSFENLYQLLLEQNPEEDIDHRVPMPISDKWQSYLVDKVRLAAILADEATKEMIYRFERQRPQKREPKSRTDGRDGDKGKTKRRRSPVRW